MIVSPLSLRINITPQMLPLGEEEGHYKKFLTAEMTLSHEQWHQ